MIVLGGRRWGTDGRPDAGPSDPSGPRDRPGCAPAWRLAWARADGAPPPGPAAAGTPPLPLFFFPKPAAAPQSPLGVC